VSLASGDQGENVSAPSVLSTSRGAVVRVLLVLTAVVLVAAACVAPPTGPTTTTTTTTTAPPRNVFCDVWAQRLAEPDPKTLPDIEGLTPPVPPVRPFAYLLDPDTVVTAQEVIARGTDCKDPEATLTFLQGSIVGSKMFRPENNLPPDGPNVVLPQAYSLNLEAGRAQAPSIEITSFNIELSFQGIRIYGTLAATINGATSTINFDGRFQDLENYSVSLDAPALEIPGFTNQPIQAAGRLERRAGLNSFSLNLRAPDLMVGDLAVRDVVVDLNATTTTGLTLVLRGQVRTVDGQVGLSLDAAFDANGQLRDIDGSLEVDVTSTTSGGETVQLNGLATITGSSSNLTASFLGSAVIGPDDYGRVGGTIRLDDTGLLELEGFFDLAKNGTTTRFQGTLTVDPNGATPSLRAQAAGSFSGLTATGEIVEVDGTVTVTVVNGVTETTVDGSLRVGTVRGRGSARVEVNGDTTTLDFAGEVELNGGRAAVAGDLVFTDGRVVSVGLTGSLVGTVPVGELALGGSFRLEGDRRGVAASIDGSITGPGVNVTGALALELDPSGGLRAARGQVTGTVNDGSYGATTFRAALVADADRAVLTGAGDFTGAGVNRGRVSAVVTVDKFGTRLDATGQVYVTSGSTTAFSDFRIVNNRLELARAALRYPPIVIDPEFLWVAFTMDPGGSCVQVRLLDSTFLAGILFGINQAKADLACP
jgi:hypothetical protein